MATVNVRSHLQPLDAAFSGRLQKPVTLTATTWHAAVGAAGNAPLNVTTGFVDPPTTSCDRIPQVVAGGGAVETINTITGLYDGVEVSETVTCAGAGATTKFTQPFDEITSWTTDIDPQDDLTLQYGDAYMSPPCGLVYVGGAGHIRLQLADEDTMQTNSNVPVGDWRRRALRIESGAATTATGLYAVW